MSTYGKTYIFPVYQPDPRIFDHTPNGEELSGNNAAIAPMLIRTEKERQERRLRMKYLPDGSYHITQTHLVDWTKIVKTVGSWTKIVKPSGTWTKIKKTQYADN
ncbi:MAG: hypothetical protein KGJ07_06480 [Patescibacteria group bacterium]|nr:hypothetical protein [Patescibacteria group bacterium]